MTTQSVEIDLGLLAELAEYGEPGQDEFLAMVINTFRRTAPQLLERVADAIAANDPSCMEIDAHSLKSSSASVGAVTVTRLAQDLETAARKGEMARASLILDDLRRSLDAFDTAVEAYLASGRFAQGNDGPEHFHNE